MVHGVTLGRQTPAGPDTCQPFVLAGGAIRGRLVRLSAAVDTILSRHSDPPLVAELLAESIVATVALASGLKYDGIFTLQVQGDGPVGTLVADATSAGALRACATYNAKRVQAVAIGGRPEHLQPHLLGAGHLAFTVDQGADTERYQGIIALTGGSLVDSVHEYFRQSEQLASIIKINVSPPSAGRGWCAGGVLIQRMPASLDLPQDEAEDLWRTAAVFLGTVTAKELFDGAIDAPRLIRRIFGTLNCSVVEPKAYRAECRCTREKTSRILASFPVDDMREYAVEGQLTMTCEFCRTVYSFSVDEIGAVQSDGAKQ